MELTRNDALASLMLLQAHRLPVKTILDAGAAEGTFFLLRRQLNLFPDAHHLFLDAMQENVEYYSKIEAAFPASHEICALASISGETDMEIDPNFYNTHIDGLQREWQPETRGYTRRHLRLRTLDEVCRERKLPGPYLLKLDVQGAELDVLRGAVDVLRESSIVVAETQVCLFRDTILEIAHFLKSQGFVLFDIVNPAYYQSDLTLYQCYCVFIHQRLDFRRMQPYSDTEAEQREKDRLRQRRREVIAAMDQLCTPVAS